MFQGLFVDGFAGGGGASTGIARAIGRDVDIAINHDPMAIAVHKANHPTTEHHCQDIRVVWPSAATRLQPVAGAWFSPDCKEHSKAKGGPVKDRNIRQLPMEIIPWLQETKPTVCYVENVEEMQQWGPLDENGHVIKALRGTEFKRWIRAIRGCGYRVDWKELRACDYGAPTSRKRLYVVMRRDKLPIVWPKPTHGRPDSPGVLSGKLLPYRTAAECIDWSIDCPSIFLTRQEVRDRKLRIKRPLEDATLRRVAHGVMRYVVNDPQPFIVPVTHNSSEIRVQPGKEPLRTITTANGGEFMAADVTLAPHITKFHSGSVGAPMDGPVPTVTGNGSPARPAGAAPLGVVAGSLARLQNGERRPGETPRTQPREEPFTTIATGGKFAAIGATMVQTGHGEREGQAPRALDVGKPLGTVVAGANNFAAVSAFLTKYHKSNTNAGGGSVLEPAKTLMAGGRHQAIVCAHMEQANTGMVGHRMTRPQSTIVGKGCTQRLVETTLLPEDALPPEMMRRAEMVAAFLVKFYGTANGQSLDESFGTVTTLPRFAVVTVTIDAVTYVIVDIGLRMLTPRELARAQGFPDSYILDPITPRLIRGKIVHKPLTVADQIRMIGNSVCPDVAEALVAANQPGIEMRMAA